MTKVFLLTQSIFTCSKSTKETPVQGVTIVDLEQVHTGWVSAWRKFILCPKIKLCIYYWFTYMTETKRKNNDIVMNESIMKKYLFFNLCLYLVICGHHLTVFPWEIMMLMSNIECLKHYWRPNTDCLVLKPGVFPF